MNYFGSWQFKNIESNEKIKKNEYLVFQYWEKQTNKKVFDLKHISDQWQTFVVLKLFFEIEFGLNIWWISISYEIPFELNA